MVSPSDFIPANRRERMPQQFARHPRATIRRRSGAPRDALKNDWPYRWPYVSRVKGHTPSVAGTAPQHRLSYTLAVLKVIWHVLSGGLVSRAPEKVPEALVLRGCGGPMQALR
jgi:hypothetical protein